MSGEKEPWQIELDPKEAYFDKAADEVLARAKAPLKTKARGPKPKKVAVKQRERALHKRSLRKTVRDAVGEVWGGVYDGEVNVITNRIWKRSIRPALAAAFAEGVEAGADAVSQCCGCSGSGIDITNPYDGSKL